MDQVSTYSSYSRTYQKVRFLTRDEEVDAFNNGDVEKLFLSQAFYIRRIAQHYAKRCPSMYEELIDAGEMAVLECLKKFKVDANCRLTTYVTKPIHWRMQKVLKQSSQAKSRLKVKSVGGLIDECIDEHEDFLDVEAREQNALVFSVLEKVLDDREKKIIRYRFFDKVTLAGVAEILGVTKERIRQLEVRALAKLREGLLNERRQPVC